MTVDVRTAPSKGRMQLKKREILSGFRIVVEKERGFALGCAIISYKKFLGFRFNCIVIKTNIITLYAVRNIFF